jgi:hypothetical protein
VPRDLTPAAWRMVDRFRNAPVAVAVHTDLVGDIVVDCDTFTGGPGDQTIVMMTAAPGSEDERKLDLMRVVGTAEDGEPVRVGAVRLHRPPPG